MVNHQNSENNEDNLIINRPHAINNMRKGMEFSFTVLGWLIWAFLCRPLMLLLLWLLGFEIFYEHMIRLGGIKALIGFSYIYFTTVFMMYLFVRGWNIYNAKKFRKNNKRKSVQNVSAADLDQYFKFDSPIIEKVQEWKDILITFQENNRVLIKEASRPDTLGNQGYFKSS